MMAAMEPLPVDEPFFRERSARVPGERRSLARASRLASALGLAVGDLHPLVVVGSKGKGTTAAYAAATLRAAGLRVGLITSPGYRSHRERVRIDGEALSVDDFAALAAELSAALSALPERLPGAGYVSPTGAFTLSGLAWLRRQGVDELVVEAGMGGASDESSLTRPAVVAVARIFEEHLGVIGDDLAGVARDKAGAVGPDTRVVVTLPQSPVVADIVAEAADRHGAELVVLPSPAGSPAAGSPAAGLPTALLQANAELGFRAAQALLAVRGRPPAPAKLPDVRLPGRMSVHQRVGPGDGLSGERPQTWVLDSAISPEGIRAALEWCRRALGEPSTVLLSIPDTKDGAACTDALAGARVVPVRSRAPHLAFSAPEPLPTLAELDLDALGPRVLALGTISFVGEALDLLDVDLSLL